MSIFHERHTTMKILSPFSIIMSSWPSILCLYTQPRVARVTWRINMSIHGLSDLSSFNLIFYQYQVLRRYPGVMEFISYGGCLVLLVNCDTKSFWGMWGDMWHYDIITLWKYAMAMQLNWYPCLYKLVGALYSLLFPFWGVNNFLLHCHIGKRKIFYATSFRQCM